MQVTIYTITYNEEIILPFFIKHYKSNLPGCRIIVFDNESTDRTCAIAKEYGCEVIKYSTDNKLNDMKYLEIKNHAWKSPEQKTEPQWVFVVDADEFCNVTNAQLEKETEAGTTVLQFAGFNMVNKSDAIDIHNITHGVDAPEYSKRYAFRSDKLSEINYNPGCHVANPVGEVKLSETVYPCYHYRYLHLPMLIDRYRRNAQRMCEENRRKGMGSHYWQGESKITADWNEKQRLAKPVREPMKTETLKLFVCGFLPEHAAQTPESRNFITVNLSALDVGEFQNTYMSEHRLLLSDLPDKHLTGSNYNTYTGLLTWRWNQKYRALIPLNKIPFLPFEQNVVWAAWPEKNWYKHSIVAHKGIKRYLDELCEVTGLSSEGTGLYGNQFICSTSVFADFLTFFHKHFFYFHSKYGFTGYDFWVKEKDKPRLPSVFYERIAAIYFANRKHLIIKQIPYRGAI